MFFPPRQPAVQSAAQAAVVRPQFLLLLSVFTLTAVAWGTCVVTGWQGSELQRFLLLLGGYGLLTGAFLVSRVDASYAQFFEVPVFVTALAFVAFGIAPLLTFLDPNQLDPHFHGSYDLTFTAFLYVVFGMLAYWLGSQLVRSRKRRGDAIGYAIEHQTLPRASHMVWIVLLCLVSSAAKGYLLWTHFYGYVLYGYPGSIPAYFQKLPTVQLVMWIAELGTCALALASIERFSHPSSGFRRALFWVVFASECGWGLIAGIKSSIVLSFVLVALISTLIRRRVRKSWVVAAALSLVVIYPISNRYRAILERQQADLGTLASVESAQHWALAEAARCRPGVSGWMASGWQDALIRLNLLQDFALMLSLGPAQSRLAGNERLWMIPYYPFLPRFVWRTKPILNKGQRFTELLGASGASLRGYTAVTAPGDLYVLFGIPGVLGGMLLMGAAGEWLTARFTTFRDKRSLFVYSVIFLEAVDLEIDCFSYWTRLLKMLAILGVLGWLIYGPLKSDLGAHHTS